MIITFEIDDNTDFDAIAETIKQAFEEWKVKNNSGVATLDIRID